jgi:hypothetical protein
MWSAINTALTGCFDLLLWPFAWAPVWLQLAVMAVPATAVMLVVFRFCSNQAALDAAKDKIKAYLLELWLYRDDLRVSLLAQGRLVLWNLRYLGHLLVPITVASVPIVLMLVQVEARYRWRSLEPGESVILAVQVEGERPSALDVALEVPEGLTRETPALRVDSRGEVSWRLRADTPGTYQIGVRVGGSTLSKRAVVDGKAARLSPERRRADDPRTLLYPLERPIPVGIPVRVVTLAYPAARGEFLELSSAGWIFAGISFVLAFVFRGTFGVTF